MNTLTVAESTSATPGGALAREGMPGKSQPRSWQAVILLAGATVFFWLGGSTEARAGLSSLTGSNNCLSCHSTASTAGNTYLNTAINGVASTSVNVVSGNNFELDWIFAINPQPCVGSGVMLDVPTGWTVASGTANSPALANWNSAWDQADGIGWNTGRTCVTTGASCNTIDYINSSWDSGGRDTAADAGTGNDGDGVANRMGADATITVPSGAAVGSYTVTAYAIGHDSGGCSSTYRRYRAQNITVNVTSTPTLTSPTATAITSTSATLGANITSNGGLALSERGTCWDTAASPRANCLAEGGTATGVFTQARSALPTGAQLYYAGYAINSVGTAYSPDGSFYTEPATQASAVNFTAVTNNSLTVNWTPGDGDGVIVVMRGGSAPSADPADGTYTGYNANTTYSNGTTIGGGYVVYKGSGSSVAVSGLTLGTTYYVNIYEYKGAVDTAGVNQGTNYKTAPATGNQTTVTVAPILTSPTATNLLSTSATLGANVSNGGASLTAKGTCWDTTATPRANCLATGSTSTGVFTQSRSGLSAGTKIYHAGYATNSIGTGYSPDGSFYTEPGAQAAGVNFTAIGTTSLTVNWTRGNGDGVIVVMRGGSAPSADPIDGTYSSYTANATYGSGATIGGGFVIYKDTGTSVTVSGLAMGTTYYVNVYEYKGSVDTSGVDQGTNYRGTPATGNQITLTLPSLTSPTSTAITDTTATIGANITATGGAAISERGTCWDVTATPRAHCLAEGGTTTGVYTQSRNALTVGSKIYYAGYAINSVGTAYSADGSFYTEPATQASGVTFTAVGATSMTVNWTRGDGDGVIVVMLAGSTPSTDPADGTYTGYNASTTYGNGTTIGGGYVIFKGGGSTVGVSGLLPNTTYFVKIYEYKGAVDTSGVNRGTNYKGTPANGSQITTTGLPVLASPTATAIADTTATLGANIIADGGAALTERGTCWNTSATPRANCLAEGGTTSGIFTQARTSLTVGSKIYYVGYAANALGTGYSADGSFYSEPATQASGVNFTAVSNNGMTVNWTRGSGDGVIVVMRADTLPTAGPTDGTYTGYSANAVFGNGTGLGGGYIIYKGNGTSVAVSGLAPSTVYYVAIYEYKGTVDTVNDNQGANYKPSPATASQAASDATYYYSQGSLNAGLTSSWNTLRGGGGSQPPDFTGANIFVIQSGHSMTTATALTLSDPAAELEIESGGALTLNSNNVSTYTCQIDGGGTMTINSSRTLTVNDGPNIPDLSVSGTLRNSGTLTLNGTMAVGSGGTYQHDINSTTIPLATWDAASTLYITGVTSGTLTNTNRNLGNVKWETTLTGQAYLTSSTSTVIYGDLIVAKTGTASHFHWSSTGVTADIRGSLRIEAAGADTARFEPFHGSGTLKIGGNFVQSVGSGTSGLGWWHSANSYVWTLEFTGSGKTITGTISNIGSAAINGIPVTIDVGASVSLNNNVTVYAPSSGNLTINGTFNLGTFTANRSVAGGTLSLGSAGFLNIGGTGTLPANYSTHSLNATSTIEYSGANQTIATLNSAQKYGNLILSGSGTKTLVGAIAIVGNWTNNSDLALAGNYTVTFSGTGAQTITGSNSWYGLAVTTATARTVTFQSGRIQTVANSLTLTGASGNKLTLAPATPGSPWYLTMNGASQGVSYVNVSYSNATGGNPINALGATNTDGGNNPNWLFYSPNTYYSQGSTNANNTTNWNSLRGGGGSAPANFTNADTFVIQNGNSMTTSATWTLASGSTVEIESGGALTASGASVSAYSFLVDAGGTMTINNGRTLTINDGPDNPDLNVYGTLVNSGTITVNGTMAVGAGGTYQHAENGGVIPGAGGNVNWDSASTLLITGLTSAPPTSGMAQSFGNLTYNCIGQTAEWTLGLPTAITGNLTVQSTGNGGVPTGTYHFQFATGAYGLNIGGNLTVTGGGLEWGHSSVSATINIGGSFLQSGNGGVGKWHSPGGTVTINFTGAGKTVSGNLNGGTSTITTLNFNLSNGASYAVAGNVTVPSGTLTVQNGGYLDVGAFGSSKIITGAGNFTLAAGGGLGIADPYGILTGTGTGATGGSIQVTGARAYDAAANYTYNGTAAAQVSGNGLSTANNLTISNASGVTMSQAIDVNNNLLIAAGTLDVSGANFAINVAGNWTNNGGFNGRAGTVTFDGATQSITGSNTWYGLAITGAAARTVSFQSGATQTVGNSLLLAGASGQLLTLAPATAGAAWNLKMNGPSQNISYLSVSYSNAGSGGVINAADGTSVNGGNNSNWSFGYSAPTVTKSFTPANIVTGGTSSMVITVTNLAGTPGNLTGVSIDDIYTGALANKAAGSVVCSGGGSATLTGGANSGTSVGFSNGVIEPGGTCTITQSVTATSTTSNSTTAPTATGPAPLTGTAAGPVSLYVYTPPTVSKTFTPTNIAAGGTSVMVISVTNPAANPATLTGVSITDIYTGTLVNKGGGSLVCDAGSSATLTGGANMGTTVGFNNGAMVPGETCTITQSVTATSNNTNSTTAPTATGPLALTGTAVGPVTLVVFAPMTLTKAVNPAAAAPGEQVEYSITYANPNSSSYFQKVVITDPIPQFTTFVSADCGEPLPANLTSCSMSLPAVGTTGTVTWTMGGHLNASATGTVHLWVKVQ